MFRALFAFAVLAGVLAAPAQAEPKCQYGPDVTADCPVGGCDALAAPGQPPPCTGPLLAPLLPPQPPGEIELGIGS
jgi:hypothetical protein